MSSIHESIAFKRVHAKETIPHLIAHLKNFPTDAKSWVALAASRYEEGEKEKAEKTLEKAFELQPDLSDAWLEKGRWLFQEANLKAALTAMNQAQALHPQDDVVLTFRGMVKRRMGKVEEARQDFLQAVAINPMQEDAHWQLRMFREQDQAREDGNWVTIATHFDPDWLIMIKSMLLDHQIPTNISQQDSEMNLDASTDYNRKLQVRLEESEQAIWLVYDWARDYHYRYLSDYEDESLAEQIKPGSMMRTGYLLLGILLVITVVVLVMLFMK